MSISTLAIMLKAPTIRNSRRKLHKVAVSSLNDAATATRKFLATHSGLGDEVVGTLSQLNDAAAAVTRLADFLERNPSALLTGKKQPK